MTNSKLVKELKYWAEKTPLNIGEDSSDVDDVYDDGMHDGRVEFAKELIDLLKSEDAWPHEQD
jgi:hypothetical protein